MRLIGAALMRRIATSMALPRAGVPSASKTTMPAGVTTKPALDMKPLLAWVAIPALPSKNQQWAETRVPSSLISTAATAAAKAFGVRDDTAAESSKARLQVERRASHTTVPAAL